MADQIENNETLEMVQVERTVLEAMIADNRAQKEELITVLEVLKGLTQTIAPMIQGKSAGMAMTQFPKVVGVLKDMFENMPELLPYFKALYEKYDLLEKPAEQLPAQPENQIDA